MKTITNYIKAGYPALWLISSEEKRVEAELKRQLSAIKGFKLYVWTCTRGVADTSNGKSIPNTEDGEISSALDAFTPPEDKTEKEKVAGASKALVFPVAKGVTATVAFSAEATAEYLETLIGYLQLAKKSLG